MLSKKIPLWICFLFYFFTVYSQGQPLQAVQQKKVSCNKAAVVSAHPLASMAGIEIMKKGGNAFDAAIATQLALAVVYPGAGNLGGGGFLVAHTKNGNNICIDYRETAPGLSHKDMYLDKDSIPIPSLSQKGHLACGTPGTVAGLFATMKYARLHFSKLVDPAIKLAENGFPVSASQAKSLNDNRAHFLTANRKQTAFTKDSLWKEGDILKQPELAYTLKRIRNNGPDEFYKGSIARQIVDEMATANGIISLQDLANYKAILRPPVEFDYKGYRIVSAPLPSSGRIMLAQMMKMVENRNIAAMGFQTAESVQLMVEIERRAYADRANFMGDADFVKVPVKHMLSSAYLQQRMSDFVPGLAGNSKAIVSGNIPESEETTHISIIDDMGNAVSVTTTLNDSYGSRVVVSGAGFLLNNEMDDFSIREGYPNLYGAIGNAANAIAPKKRMLSSMTPTIVLKDGLPYIIAGSPGGTTITTSIFQTLINLLEFRLSPEDAVNKPKFHHQWLPDMVYTERKFPETVSGQLTLMGYTITAREPIGRTELIVINRHQRKKITAIADFRGDDDARGF